MTTLAADGFGRTVSSGWGTADTGGAWTPTNAAYFSVNGSRGLVASNAGSTPIARLGSVSATTSDLTVNIGISALPVGGTIYHFINGRSLAESSGSTTSYGCLLTIAADGTVSLFLRINGTGSMLTATGLKVTAADRINVHLRVAGTSPTRIQARAWKAGTTEPVSWQIDATDSTSGLQVAGAIALGNYLSSATTNGPIQVSWDALAVTDGATTNIPPTVSAGADQSGVVGTAVALKGTAADSDGTITSVAWTCTASPGAAPTITGASTLNASFTPTASGNYVFQLAVTDSGGATSTDTVTVPVASASVIPPTINGSTSTALAVIDVRASTGTGTLSYSSSPATLLQPVAGYFVVQQTSAAQTFKITATDASTGASSSKNYTVPAATVQATGYNGSVVELTLPSPLDPATQDDWGATLNSVFSQLQDALNGVIGYYNSLSG